MYGILLSFDGDELIIMIVFSVWCVVIVCECGFCLGLTSSGFCALSRFEYMSILCDCSRAGSCESRSWAQRRGLECPTSFR